MPDPAAAPNSRSSHRQHLRRWGAAYAILAIALGVTAVAFALTYRYAAARDQRRFEEMSVRAFETFRLHTEFYLNYLKAVGGLFTAQTDVNQQRLEQFLETSGIRQSHAGLVGIGYALRVPAEAQQDHVALMRRQGHLLYGIIGRSIEPAASFPIVYFDSFRPGGLIALGWNPASDPARWAALQQARDSGQPVSTSRVELHSHPPTNSAMGFLIYVPVYGQPGAPASIEARRAALTGFVFGSFIPSEVWDKVIAEADQPALELRVYASHDPVAAHFLYTSAPASEGAGRDAPPRFSGQVTMTGLGRDWCLAFSTLPGFERDSRRSVPWWTMAGGLVVSVLLFGLTCVQVRARARAERVSQDLRNSQADLVAEKERLTVTLRSISEGVIATDVAGHILLLNQAAEQLTGWQAGDAVGKPLAAVFRPVRSRTREPGSDLAGQVLATGLAAEYTEPSLLAARAGQERTIAASAAPMRDDRGGVLGVVLVFRDITEQQRLEEELLKNSKLESLGVLAGGIAHDFNNVLMAVIGNLSVAKMTSKPGSEVFTCLEQVEQAAMRARELTAQLLTFAKGGAPVKRVTALGDLLQESVPFILRGSNVRCELELAPNLRAVEVDAAQVGQVLQNLVINAMQAMPEGGVVRIQGRNLESSADPGPVSGREPWVEISVSDQGSGIRPEHLARVFDPYFTTKQRGSGLGLTTAYSIIQKHGGALTVDSTLGKGSTFRVRLPATSRSAAPAPAAAGPPPPVAGRGRVLVMDDEEAVRAVVRTMLRRLGYDVQLSEDGNAAIETYMQAARNGQPFDLVLMDLTIPGGLGGKETLARLRSLDPKVRAVVSSGYSNDPVMANYRDYGFHAVLEKPYRTEQLARVLQEVLGKDAVL